MSGSYHKIVIGVFCLFRKERVWIIGAGLVVGVISVVLVLLGNPANMGFCIACFLRDTAGGLGLHRAPVVQYIRPEIVGLTTLTPISCSNARSTASFRNVPP